MLKPLLIHIDPLRQTTKQRQGWGRVPLNFSNIRLDGTGSKLTLTCSTDKNLCSKFKNLSERDDVAIKGKRVQAKTRRSDDAEVEHVERRRDVIHDAVKQFYEPGKHKIPDKYIKLNQNYQCQYSILHCIYLIFY